MNGAKKLIPPDFDQCQAEKPKYIVFEPEMDEDGYRGSMSLCISCKNVFLHQMVDAETYKFTEII